MDDLIFRWAAIEAMTADNLTRNMDSVFDDDLKRAARAAQRAIARLPAAQRWIPVTEKLPEEKRAVLVWQPRYLNSYTAILADGEWFVFGGYGTKVFEVTHWMPLPEPAKEEP